MLSYFGSCASAVKSYCYANDGNIFYLSIKNVKHGDNQFCSNGPFFRNYPALEVFRKRYALYKSTFYLLYLLTYVG